MYECMYVCMYVCMFVTDAAHSALYVKNVQFFYDEIEAELNLVIDQVRPFLNGLIRRCR